MRAVLVESFERIHRSNLIGMGVLPLQYRPGESAASLGLTGREVFDVTGHRGDELRAGSPREVTVRADGREFRAVVRIDTPGEAEYYRHGGIMQYVLRSCLFRIDTWPGPTAHGRTGNATGNAHYVICQCRGLHARGAVARR